MASHPKKVLVRIYVILTVLAVITGLPRGHIAISQGFFPWGVPLFSVHEWIPLVNFIEFQQFIIYVCFILAGVLFFSKKFHPLLMLALGASYILHINNFFSGIRALAQLIPIILLILSCSKYFNRKQLSYLAQLFLGGLWLIAAIAKVNPQFLSGVEFLPGGAFHRICYPQSISIVESISQYPFFLGLIVVFEALVALLFFLGQPIAAGLSILMISILLIYSPAMSTVLVDILPLLFMAFPREFIQLVNTAVKERNKMGLLILLYFSSQLSPGMGIENYWLNFIVASLGIILSLYFTFQRSRSFKLTTQIRKLRLQGFQYAFAVLAIIVVIVPYIFSYSQPFAMTMFSGHRSGGVEAKVYIEGKLPFVFNGPWLPSVNLVDQDGNFFQYNLTTPTNSSMKALLSYLCQRASGRIKEIYFDSRRASDCHQIFNSNKK